MFVNGLRETLKNMGRPRYEAKQTAALMYGTILHILKSRKQ